VSEHVPRRRLTLLLHRPAFRSLFLATLGSGVGTYLAALVLTVSIRDKTHSGTWVAALLVADLLPIFLIGVTLGPLIDRLSRKRLMIGADLVRLGVFAVLPFAHKPGEIVALAAITGVATGFFKPAVFAGVPNLVDGDDELAVANSLLSGIDNLAWMVGPLIGAALLVVSGPNLAYWINAATFLLSAVLISGIPAARLQSEESLSRGHWRDVRDGIALVLGTPQLRTVLIVWNVVIVGNAALNVAEVFFAKDSLNSGNFGYGVLVAATGAGLIIGSLLAPFVLEKIGLRRLYPCSVGLMGVGALAAAAAPTVWVAAPLIAIATLGNGAAIVCNQLLVQRGAPDTMRGRAIAVLMSSTSLTIVCSMAITGVLTNEFGGRALWVVAGCIYLFGSALAYVRTRALRRVLETPALADRIEAATQV
jgi:MFS family permease